MHTPGYSIRSNELDYGKLSLNSIDSRKVDAEQTHSGLDTSKPQSIQQQYLPPHSEESAKRLAQDSLPIWQTFSSGMEMLKSNLYKTESDLISVAKSNIRLLNSQLENTSLYRSHQKRASSRKQPKWMWSTLYETPEIEAGLLTFDTDSPFRINPLDYRQTNGLQQPQATEGPSELEGGCQMILVVSGKIRIHSVSPFTAHTNKLTNGISKQKLRPGNVYINNFSNCSIQTIFSCKSSSSILSVTLRN